MAFTTVKFITLLCLLNSSVSQALSWSANYVDWNLNQNESANGPLDYWGEWKEHPKTPSPSNWRMPFYMLTLDRYVDGQPTNNDANGTVFEHDDWSTNQFRFGGDAVGLMNNLDWIQDLGIKVSTSISRLLRCASSPQLSGTVANQVCRPSTSRARLSSTSHGLPMALGHSTLHCSMHIMERSPNGAN